MTKEKAASEARPEKKNGQKVQAQPSNSMQVQAAVEVSPAVELARPGMAAATGGADGNGTQSSRLSDSRLRAAQRQGLARQIGRQQGNNHLQRLIVSLQRDEPVIKTNGNHRPNGHHLTALSGGDVAEQDWAEELDGFGKPASAAAAAGIPTSPGDPPKNGRRGLIQRQDEGEEDDTPTEEEKAAAIAAAQQAEGEATQSADQAASETAKSRGEAAREAQGAEAAAQKVEQVKGEGKAIKGEGAAQAVAGKAPGKESGSEAGQTAKAAPAQVEAAPAAAGVGAGAGAGAAGAAAGEIGAQVGEKAPASPDEDPAFQKVVAKARSAGVAEKKHIPAKSKAGAAQAAAEMPGAEVEAHAQAGQVGKMESTPTPGFNGAAFKAKLMARIQQMAPKNAEQADQFKGSGKMDAVKGDMQNQAAAERDSSKEPLEQAAGEAPDTGSVPPKPVEPLSAEPPGEQAGVPGAEGAAPKQKTSGEVEAPVKAETQRIDQQMSEADITDEQLAKSNEPEFIGALNAKKEAKANAETAPGEYRQFEQAELGQAQNEAAATAQEKTQAMHGERAAVFAQVGDRQGQTKSKDEQARAKVAADIQAIYARTKSNVERILSELDGKVSAAFDQGAAAAKTAFEDFVDARMEAYKERRYGGWFGWARWIKDKVGGMPGEVNVFYTEGRNLFLQKMDAVIDTVVEIIGKGLAEAKAEIANGKKEIAKYVSSLPKELQKVGQDAASGMEEQFAGLERSVDAKQDELVETLASKYQEHLKAVDSRIEELKAANRGLVDKVIDAVAGVIKVILKLKDLLTTVLAKIASVVGKILKDPIGFLGNLIAGIKQGFSNFVGNIMTHLQTGLIGWLTGELGPMGIQIPDDVFSLPGIFSLVMQVLGISWAYVRAKAVKLLGEPVVKALETGFEVFKILITEGPAGLWKYVQDQFTNLKEMVIEEIKSMVITEIIKAGVKWVLSLLNPAAALIKAAMAIYDIVMFFIQKGSQIMDLINSVIDGIGAIASGAISGAAALIENALAKALPLIIGFLANLLGLGGLAKKVQNIITKIRDKVDAAIDAILLKAKKFVGGLFGKGNKKEGEAVSAEGETEKSIAVKGKVRKELEKRTTQPFEKVEDLQAVVGQVENQYKPEGLKKLTLVPDKNKAGLFSIVAVASDPVTVDQAEVQVGSETEVPVKVGDKVDLRWSKFRKKRKQWLPAAVTEIDQKQKLITIQVEGMNDFQKMSFESFKKGEGTTWRPPGEIHEKFLPKIISVVDQNGVRTITFEYEDEDLPMTFTVRQNLSDFHTTSVEAKNLTVKPAWGRGVTETPATHQVNQGLERAHVIADWFGGSGYKESLNLITTSGTFNRDKMGGVERKIVAGFVSNNANSFDLSIEVKWGEFVSTQADNEAIKTIASSVSQKHKGNEQAPIQQNIEAFITSTRKLDGVPFRKCENVIYTGTYFDQGGQAIKPFHFVTGPDKWIQNQG